VKTSAQANFLLTDHSMFCVARLPLQELILCFQTDDAFIPGRPPFHTIPGSLVRQQWFLFLIHLWKKLENKQCNP